MPNPCEIVESLATTVTTVVLAMGISTYDIAVIRTDTYSGPAFVYATDQIHASDWAEDSSYTILAPSLANATSSATPQIVYDEILSSTGGIISSTSIQYTSVLIDNTAAASSSLIVGAHDYTLASSASASSSALPNTVISATYISHVGASNSVILGGTNTVSSTASASSDVTTDSQEIFGVYTSIAAVSDTVFDSVAMLQEVVISSAQISSAVILANNILVNEVYSEALASSAVIYQLSGEGIWLMNADTSAVSTYSLVGFDSITQSGGVTYLTGDGGLYKFGGDLDEGISIIAELKSGWSRLGSADQKRVSSAYVNYTSNGDIAIQLESYGQNSGVYAHTLQARQADAPMANRALFGRGTVSTYWRVDISNTDGSAFNIYNIDLDVAASSRRV